MRTVLLPALLLFAASAACSSGPRLDAKFERPIPVEARADGAILVDGKPAAWDSLGDALLQAIRARSLPPGTRASATLRVERGCPEGTSSRLLDAVIGAGVREILYGGSEG